MKGVKRISKYGKTYYCYYTKKNKPSRERTLYISKSGNLYFNYYKKKDKPSAKSVRDKRFIIDNYKCTICGRGYKLLLHHRDRERTNNRADNLIALCYKCHRKHHLNLFQRHNDIIRRYQSGESQSSIAKYYSVSRQRIHQIIKSNQY